MRKKIPLSRIKSVNESIIEYLVSNNSGISIVMLNGFRIPLYSWNKLYPAVENFGKIILYNRLGIGKSLKPLYPQTGIEVIRVLKELLQDLEIKPPYILVAHSLGGLYANLFARLHPDETAGIVFVEATHPEEKKKQNAFRPPLFFRIIAQTLNSIEKWFNKYAFSEDECFQETIKQIESAGEFPAIPVAVATGTKRMPLVSERNFSIHIECQKELLLLSPRSFQIMAGNSGHFPQITEPELVNEAINKICMSI